MTGLVLGLTLLAAGPEVARHVIVVGSNDTAEGLTPLRFADDDAVLYARHLAPYARTVDLLTVADDTTQLRYPSAVPQAALPTSTVLRATLARRFAEMRDEQARGLGTELVFIFVGHGGQDDDGLGFLYLADARLTRAQLFSEVLGASPADRTHLIVDACHAYSLVASRGDPAEDARRKALGDFLAGEELADYPSAGVLVATSDTQETHEWSRLEAGVFSHLVRSALTGAGDINGDGRIEYSEAAAFIHAASAELAQYGRRLSVYAWPPARDRRAALVDQRQGVDTRYIVLGPTISGHLTLDSADGERWAEWNKAPGFDTTLAVPADRGFFLRDAKHEVFIAPDTEVEWVEAPPTTAYTVAKRGAVEVAFEKGLFVAPFGRDYYRGFVSDRAQFLPVLDAPALVERAAPLEWRFDVQAGYAIAPFVLRSDRLEHKLFARLLASPREHLFLSFTAWGAYASLQGTRAESAQSFGGMAGVGTQWSLTDRWAVQAAVEGGVGQLYVGGPFASRDSLTGVASMRAGATTSLMSNVTLVVDLQLLVHRVTVSAEEQTPVRPQLAIGLAL